MLSYINILDKKTEVSISKKFKTRTFQQSVNMILHAKKSIILQQHFGSKYRIFHFQKFKTRNLRYLVNMVVFHAGENII